MLVLEDQPFGSTIVGGLTSKLTTVTRDRGGCIRLPRGSVRRRRLCLFRERFPGGVGNQQREELL